MSAVQAAIRRRATPQPTTPPTQQSPAPSSNTQPNGSGLTIQQVIQVIDTRLINLETFMKETQSAPPAPTSSKMEDDNTQETGGDISLNTILDEYNTRFEVIANEISLMKEIIMKLQTFTMEVNKKIMDNYIELVSKNMSVSEPTPIILPTNDVSTEMEVGTEMEVSTENVEENVYYMNTDMVVTNDEMDTNVSIENEEEIKPVYKKSSNKKK